MALRNILIDGDERLRKTSRAVTQIDDRIRTLLDDMAETMAASNGVGLAAPQVGVLRRIAVVDTGDGQGVLELINPEILEREGEQCFYEGCLSVPEVNGYTIRPRRIVVSTEDRGGLRTERELVGFRAVVACHEIDHLDGILFTDKTIEPTAEQLANYDALIDTLSDAEKGLDDEPAQKPLRGRRNTKVVKTAHGE